MCDTPTCPNQASHLVITVYNDRETQTRLCDVHTGSFRLNLGSVEWPADLRMVMVVSLADIYTPDSSNAAATADAHAN